MLGRWIFNIYTLSVLCILSNLIGSPSRTIKQLFNRLSMMWRIITASEICKFVRSCESRIGQLHDDDIWLQLPEFISVLLCYLNLSIPLRTKKNNSLNLHKKTTNSMILVVVLKWRHRAIVLFINCFVIHSVLNKFTSSSTFF